MAATLAGDVHCRHPVENGGSNPPTSTALPLQDGTPNCESTRPLLEEDESHYNPLYPKVFHTVEELIHHTARLRQAYEMLHDIMHGRHVGYHPSHVTHREVISLRAALEGTRSVAQHWWTLWQAPDPVEGRYACSSEEEEEKEAFQSQRDLLRRRRVPPCGDSDTFFDEADARNGPYGGRSGGEDSAHRKGSAAPSHDSFLVGSSSSFAGSSSHGPAHSLFSPLQLPSTRNRTAAQQSPALQSQKAAEAGPSQQHVGPSTPGSPRTNSRRTRLGVSEEGDRSTNTVSASGTFHRPLTGSDSVAHSFGNTTNPRRILGSMLGEDPREVDGEADTSPLRPGAAALLATSDRSEGHRHASRKLSCSSPQDTSIHEKKMGNDGRSSPKHKKDEGSPSETTMDCNNVTDSALTRSSPTASGVPERKGKTELFLEVKRTRRSSSKASEMFEQLQEVRRWIQMCESMAEELEDHVEDSCIAKTWDPVYDVQLNLFEEGYRSPVLPCGSSLPAAHHLLPHTHGLPSVLDSPTGPHAPPVPIIRPRGESNGSGLFSMANFLTSPLRLGSTRSAPAPPRQLGCSPSAPTSASWPPYWRIIVQTPWVRRLELFTAGFFNFFVCCQVCVVSTLLCLFLTPWYIRLCTLLYLLYIFTLGRPRFPIHPNQTYRQLFIWKYFRDYFPARLLLSPEVAAQFDPSCNYVFGYHPHAAHAFGALITFGVSANGLHEGLPGIHCHLQTLRINFFVPIWREFSFWMGLGDASYRGIQNTLRAGPGQSVVLAIGGAEESLFSRPRSNDIVLERRKGFVKVALETGSHLVPVYGFGETNTYEVRSMATSPSFYRWAQRVKRITGFMMPLICGRGPLALVPLRRPIQIVMGPPVRVPDRGRHDRTYKPSQEEIDLYHQKYVVALEKLYQEYCGVYDVGSEPMKIVK